METIFKEGDRVYHIQLGWGIISKVSNKDILVGFDNAKSIWSSIDSNLFSFTEYTLQGFSQERPIELPEVGELCLVRDGEGRTWIAKEFIEYKKNNLFPYITKGDIAYKEMKRIKILD